jgi:16S rRNA processing protein RimM
VVLGRIAGAHGLRGQVRIRCFGDGPENLLRVPRVTIGESEEDPEATVYEVTRAEPGRPGEVRMRLRGVDRREAAEPLRGRLVMADPAHFESLPEGEYYGFEIVGCRVEDEDGRRIGVVTEIWSTGAPDVLVVTGERDVEHLIPAALLREVDIEGRRVVIDLLPGLLDVDE